MPRDSACLRLLVAAHRAAQGGRGSGYDVATSVWGGVVQLLRWPHAGRVAAPAGGSCRRSILCRVPAPLATPGRGGPLPTSGGSVTRVRRIRFRPVRSREVVEQFLAANDADRLLRGDIEAGGELTRWLGDADRRGGRTARTAPSGWTSFVPAAGRPSRLGRAASSASPRLRRVPRRRTCRTERTVRTRFRFGRRRECAGWTEVADRRALPARCAYRLRCHGVSVPAHSMMGELTGRATGKLLLFGEHAAVYGHPALGISLPWTAGAEDHPRCRRRPRRFAPGHRATPGAAGASSPRCSPCRHLHAVVEIRSQIPIGLGFGSSAALCVAAERAPDERRVRRRPGAAAVWRTAPMNRERVFHGTPSGADTGLAASSRNRLT